MNWAIWLSLLLLIQLVLPQFPLVFLAGFVSERFIAYSAALIDVSEPSIATSILKFYLFSFLFQGGLMLACYIYKFKLTIPDAMAFTKETRGRKKTFEYWFYLVKDSIQAFFTLPLCLSL